MNPTKMVINGQTVEFRSDGIPIQPITKEKYEQLTEDEKQQSVLYLVNDSENACFYFRGKPIFGLTDETDVGGGSGGNPIGTIISFMGIDPPKGYLVCDGSVYNISDYPRLATFFEQQFGDKQYFGGEGEQFAVPDMRNLFLRGYHGEAEEQLSGDIGQKQEATSFPNIRAGTGVAIITPAENVPINNADSYNNDSMGRRMFNETRSDDTPGVTSFTSRPVNMAVLYCIKAIKEESYEEIYSEEETVIGRWIDGKSIYRRVIIKEIAAKINESYVFHTMKDVDTIINFHEIFLNSNGTVFKIPDSVSRLYVRPNGEVVLYPSNSDVLLGTIYFCIEYTKTTDQGGST